MREDNCGDAWHSMSTLRFVPRLLAELCLPPDFRRRPEPDLVMDREEQVAGYLKAGSATGGMFALHLFHAAHMTHTIYGARTVVDLACGPATQLLLMAGLHPDIQFTGVDLSTPMLAVAERNSRELGLKNVDFVQDDIANLRSLERRSFDAATSTMALHHLPTVDHLERCFVQIEHILSEARTVYLADLLRPTRAKTVEFLAHLSSDIQPKVFNDDYRNSMLAAFQPGDFRRLVYQHLPSCECYVTRPMRLFIVVKTKSRPIPGDLRSVFRKYRADLPRRLRKDLDDLRFFFRLGGLRQDPFA